MQIQFFRYLLGNLLILAAAAVLLSGGALMWLVAAATLAIGGPLDDAAGDDDCRLSEAQRGFFNTNLYVTLPLLGLLTFAMLHRVAVHFDSGYAATLPYPLPGWGGGLSLGSTLDTAIGVVLTGYCYAMFGATVGHELTHRPGVASALVSARGLLAFTFNTSFTTFHVHGHHRQVATYRDPATARRGEYILAFVVRTLVSQTVDSMAFEAVRTRRLGLHPYGLHNLVVRGQFYSLALLLAAATFAGLSGLEAAAIAGVLGRLLHELTNYVQHFGLVRVDGQPIQQRHSWDCRRLLSNALQYNLPLHADHHMFAQKAFWQLRHQPAAPLLPFGYQTMVFIALVPALWRRTMTPLLAQWDQQASADEVALIRERGWLGLV